jgi:hypothetical protein
MKKDIQLLNNTVIRIGQVTLSPWPCFKVEGECENLPGLLVELLLSNESVPILWSAKLSDELRQLLLSFPESLMPDLLTLSQMWPDKFVDWASWCPALITLLTQTKAEDGERWDDFDRLRAMQGGWREVLKLTGWPVSYSMLKLLRKLPINHCSPQNLAALRAHIGDRRKLKLLRHCSRISGLTLETLTLPAEMLSVRLLEFDENDLLPLEVESLVELCRELVRFRQELGRLPLWAYAHGRFSARTLHHAVQLQRMLICCKKQGLRHFPLPPLPTIKGSKFCVQPLTSLSAIHREGNQQQNCVVSYGVHVLEGTHYVYRLMAPERATVLLLRHGDDWYPAQIKTYRNGNPRPETIELIEKWLGTKLEKEAQDDFPF